MGDRRTVWLARLALALAAALGACNANSPDGRPERQCFDRCRDKLASACTEDQCVRGCRFVLDRLVEHEGPGVLACVARGDTTKKPAVIACDDDAWATCAAKVGVHADGGPPAPPPANDDWE